MALYRNRIIAAERITTLTTFEDSVMVRLRQVIAQKSQSLLAKVQADVSNGVLHTRSGKLFKSLKLTSIEDKFQLRGGVKSNWFIARFYEVGYGGKTVRVKAHERAKTYKVVRGKSFKKSTRISFVADAVTHVNAFERRIPKVKKSFLRASFETMRSEIRSALAEAVSSARGT